MDVLKEPSSNVWLSETAHTDDCLMRDKTDRNGNVHTHRRRECVKGEKDEWLVSKMRYLSRCYIDLWWCQLSRLHFLSLYLASLSVTQIISLGERGCFSFSCLLLPPHMLQAFISQLSERNGREVKIWIMCHLTITPLFHYDNYFIPWVHLSMKDHLDVQCVSRLSLSLSASSHLETLEKEGTELTGLTRKNDTWSGRKRLDVSLWLLFISIANVFLRNRVFQLERQNTDPVRFKWNDSSLWSFFFSTSLHVPFQCWNFMQYKLPFEFIRDSCSLPSLCFVDERVACTSSL